MQNQRAPRRAGQSRGKPNLELLRLRMDKGLSRRDIGDLAGISEKQVGLIERGVVRSPREDTMKAIASIFETQPSTLFSPEDRLVARRRRTKQVAR